MSDTAERDAFLKELQELVAKDAPVGRSAETAPDRAEATLASSDPAPVVPTPLSQPDESNGPVPEAVQPVAQAPSVNLEPVKLEGSDALDGVLVFNEGDEPVRMASVRTPARQKATTAVKMRLVASVMVLLAAGYLMIPSDLVPEAVAQSPAALSVAASEQGEVAQERTATVAVDHSAATAPAADPISVGIDLSAMVDSPQSQADLVAEMQRDTQVIPEAEQSCASGALSNSDRRVCNTAGHVRFFACTNDAGRIWDVHVAGCEVI